jgi:hypothetical protein
VIKFNFFSSHFETCAKGRAEELLVAVQDKSMEQLVDFPTQVKGLVIINIPESSVADP